MFSLPQSSESQVKKKRIKSCFRETFGQHQGPTSSAFEDLKRQKNYWQCWISQVALKCSVSLKVCSQMKQQSNEQFWHVVNYERERDVICIMHLLSLFSSQIIVILLIEIFMYQVQGSGVYVHVNLISQRLWNLWHARGIRPQAVSVLLRYMNHTHKKAVYCICCTFAHLHKILTCSSNVNTFVKLTKLTPLCKICPCFQWCTICSL